MRTDIRPACGELSPVEPVLTPELADGVDKDQIIPMDHEALPIGDISRFFLGRDDILARLDACFPVRDTGGKPRREFLLYGMGGVGKTQTALQAADHLEDRYVGANATPGLPRPVFSLLCLTMTKQIQICLHH